jgi:guanidinoacetate N-methyltransferase
MRRLRRYKDFELVLDLPRPEFIRAPRDAQREWLVGQAIDELIEQLRFLDRHAPGLVEGRSRGSITERWATAAPALDGEELVIDDQEVMQSWERPLMRRLAELVTAGSGDVLEIGFGMGISATFIEDLRPRSHTVIEMNADVARRARAWAAVRPDRDIEIVEASWQEALPGLGLFDGILWDAFPTSDDEYVQSVLRDSTVAEACFAHAAAHLREDGTFTYYTNELDSLSRRHQRALLRAFGSFSAEVVTGLEPPHDCQYWWSDRMAVVRAKP